MSLIKINKSCIFTFGNENYVKDYCKYIISLLTYIINKNNLTINIILGGGNYEFNNKNKTLKININIEHILVKKGGRSVPGNTPIGNVECDKDDYYLVRINNFHELTKGNIVIDYSNPNIFNVKTSNMFAELSDKHIYISPSLYENMYIDNKNRNISSLSTFISTTQPRRKKLLENIKRKKLDHININNLFDKSEIQKLYQNTKVLINIHQTEHHHTFEELRCLPALQNGVIVVAEKSPLNYLIPYTNLIIWCDYDTIITKVKEVLDNYEEYYSNIFTKKNIDILKSMDSENKERLEDEVIKNISCKKSEETLEILAKNYGLDKSISTGCHNYIPGYTKLFQNIRYSSKNLLEIGIGSLENGQMGGKNGPVAVKYNYKTGNSLKCWSEYFPCTNIYGIDIYSHPELNKDRIMTFVANQNSEQDLKNVMNKINTKLDIIIDDGSHQGEHQIFSFMYLHKYLSLSGIYVIEDVQAENIEQFKDLSIFPIDFKNFITEYFDIEYFDTRNTAGRFRSDDFMISFTKKN